MSEQSTKQPEPPSNWVRTKLGNVISLEYGKGLPKKDRDAEGKCPVYGSNGVVGYHSEPLVEGPVLIVGRKGAVGEIHLSDGPCWPIDTTYFVRKSEHLDLHFTYYLLKASRLRSLDKSTAIPGLNREDAYDQDVPIPPLNEQRRIVNKIEALFTRLDAGVQELQQSKERLQQYRRAVLKAAVEGKLTAEWRKENLDRLMSGAQLIEHIAEKRKTLWKEEEAAKQESQGKTSDAEALERRYSPPSQAENRPVELPDYWEWTNLETLTYFTVDYRGKTPPESDSGIPIISAANVNNGRIVIKKPRFVSKETYNTWTTRGVPEPGDLIITTEAPVGQVALYPKEEDYLLTRRVIACKVTGVQSSFLMYWLMSKIPQDYLKQNSRGTTVPRILKPVLMSTPVALPPLEEQRTIVSEIERCYSIIDDMIDNIDERLSQASQMRHSVLKQAFSGNLVPQDPNDEPAEKLLERIKQEKQDGKKPSKNSTGTKPGEQQRLIDHAD